MSRRVRNYLALVNEFVNKIVNDLRSVYVNVIVYVNVKEDSQDE